MDHICLIDGTNMIRRAFGVAGSEKNAQGDEIGASILFAQMLRKLLRRMADGKSPPTAAAIFFDPERGSNWRCDISEAYKAARPEPDPDFLSQVPLMRDMCAEIGLAQALAERHEADDLIAAYAADASAAGYRVSIISTDKDLMGIVGPGIIQFDPVRDVWFNAAAVREKFGVPPALLPDLLALIGDPGKNVPGAPGIGGKTAAEIIGEIVAAYPEEEVRRGCMSLILKEAQNPEIVRRPSARKALTDHAESVILSRRLVSLDAEGAPRPFGLPACAVPDLETAVILLTERERGMRAEAEAARASSDPSGP